MANAGGDWATLMRMQDAERYLGSLNAVMATYSNAKHSRL